MESNSNSNQIIQQPEISTIPVGKPKKAPIITIILLFFISLGLIGYIAYDKTIGSAEKENHTLGKPPVVSTVNNLFSTYSTNMQDAIAKYKDDLTGEFSYNEQNVSSACVSDGYSAYIKSNGDLYVKFYNSALITKYGDNKLSSGVLSFYVLPSGQGGCNSVYFIKNNGTVSIADVEYAVNQDKDITVSDNIGNYTDIVSIIGGIAGDSQSGAAHPFYVDVNGNIFGSN